MRINSLLLVIGLLFMFCVGCDDTVTAPPQTVQSVTDEESDLLAMYTMQTLTPDSILSARVYQDLKLIRNTFTDSLPIVNLTFRNVHKPSMLLIKLDSIQGDSNNVMYSLPASWDSLNQLLGLNEVSYLFSTWIAVSFERLLNPNCLVDLYAGKEGILYINVSSFLNTYPTIMMQTDGDKRYYYFCNTKGDIIIGPLYHDIYFFSVEDNTTDFVDLYLGWDRFLDDSLPAWMNVAADAFENQVYTNVWRKDSTL